MGSNYTKGINEFKDDALEVNKLIENIYKDNDTIAELKLRNQQRKEKLSKLMADYDIKSFKSDKFKILKIKGATRRYVDSNSLKKILPEVYWKFSTITVSKPSVKITKIKKGDS